jgi:hypothetical protein
MLAFGGHRVVSRRDLFRWMPRSRDAGLQGYLARVRAEAGQTDVALFASNFQVELGWVVFRRFCQFLEGLYQFTGLPALQVEADLFLGNYRRTTLGVHRDSAHVFCLAVEGRKRVRVWPAEAVSSISPRTGPRSYAHLLKNSLVLEGGSGDILYWPASYWHIAESDGRPGSSLSLAFYYGDEASGAASDAFATWAAEVLGNCGVLESLPFSVSRVAAPLVSAAARAQRSARPLAEALLRSWMARISGYGFARLPHASRRSRLQRGSKVSALPGVPILYHRIGRQLVVAANGRSEVFPYHRQAENCLRALLRGGPWTVDGLPVAGGHGRSAAAGRVLQFLWEAHALCRS